jgi:hypothetical protein
MKKIIICILIVFFTNTLVAQTLITDTTKYLRDSIEARKTSFVGKNLNYFLSNLKISVKDYLMEPPLPNRPDTLKIKRIVLYFNTASKVALANLQGKKNPGIVIIFNIPKLVPKAYLKRGGILDFGTLWNSTKANFLGNCVIQNLYVEGL